MDNKTEYKVVSFQKQQTKNGKEMWRIGMINPKDEKPLTGVIWEEDIPRFDILLNCRATIRIVDNSKSPPHVTGGIFIK